MTTFAYLIGAVLYIGAAVALVHDALLAIRALHSAWTRRAQR